ncbi:MAG: hypothetical protein Q8J68_00525 [Methanolobus sp.]|uniref:hypothetical protein n=1 Tax=Methanolobus sp. TaxID=1874737 RepID=UPI00272EFE9F|nr:hypothetical protein [Methanolobus sp.]MDP2215767.1 hypothetical protein [Methanolobus sp.]
MDDILPNPTSKMGSETRIVYTQGYEISTKIGAEIDSKGNIKPNAQVTISRRLESGDEIRELIHADVSRGVEEVMTAINEILKRGAQ